MEKVIIVVFFGILVGVLGPLKAFIEYPTISTAVSFTIAIITFVDVKVGITLLVVAYAISVFCALATNGMRVGGG